jgi:hypothetical protein
MLSKWNDEDFRKDHRQKILEKRNTKRYLLTGPDGVEYKPESVSSFCEEHNFTLSVITQCEKEKVVKRGAMKGWKIERIG